MNWLVGLVVAFGGFLPAEPADGVGRLAGANPTSRPGDSMPISVPGSRPRGLAMVMLLPLVMACTAGPSRASGASGSASPSPVASPTASESTARLVLRVTSEGGFIGPAAGLNAVPQVSVYGDGRIMTPGPVDAIFPAPLLPTVAVKDVGPTGVAAIVAAIRAAGLDKAGASAAPGIPGDTGTTIFSVDVDAATVTTRIVLAGGLPGRPGVATPDPAVAAAADLLTRLTDPNETWGATNPRVSTLTPVAYRIFVAPGAPASDGTMTTEPPRAWPLATPLDQFGSLANPDRGIAGLRQGAAFGTDAATLGPILASANSQTSFISGGMLYTLYVRPLLPDEVPTPG